MSLKIDNKILREAHHLSGKRTESETVNEALEEYVRRREQLQAIDAFGTIDRKPR